MKKFTSTLLLSLLCCIPAIARQPEHGYRGFVEWSNDITSYRYDDDGTRFSSWSTGFSTSHGYQFNPNLFLGAGIGLQGWVNNPGSDLLPLFVQVRTDQNWNGFTPYGDLRIGGNLCDGGGLFLSPSVGYRFNWGRKVGINLGIGLTLRGSTHDKYSFDVITTPNGETWVEGRYLGKQHQIKPMFNIRLGIDF